MSILKDDIIKLRNEGKTYDEISSALNCSKGTISYYCGVNQKEKTKLRTRKYRKTLHPYCKKISRFQQPFTIKNKRTNKNKWRKIMTDKINDFHKTNKTNKNARDSEKNTFTVEDVIDKFGESPVCYITGDSINIYDTASFNFDHIMPRSRGGKNNLNNLGICTKQANSAKGDMTPEEFLSFCKKVVFKMEAEGLEPSQD